MIQKLVREVGAEALRRQLVIDDHITGAFEDSLGYARPELHIAELERLPGRAEAQGILFLAQAEKLLASPILKDRVELLKWMAEWRAETLKQFDIDHSNWLRNMQRAREKAKEKGQPVKADPVQFAGGSPWDFDG